MIEIGKYSTLEALRRTQFGMVLGNAEEEVLLPNKYVPADLKPGESAEVFVYLDSEERIVATTLHPYVQLNEFAVLKVKDVNKAGAFLDWGLEKDLFVPFSEQQKNMRQGESHLIYLYLDEESNRLTATSKIDKFLRKGKPDLSIGEEVNLLIGVSSPVGIIVIINNLYKGLIYHNEIFRQLKPGEKTTGFIKTIREDDKIDVSLQPQGFRNIDPSSQIILDKLRSCNGFLPLNDNSDPAEITAILQMSKKTFKKAVGVLYKQRKIEIRDNGIYLL
jgi:uncharacterized protein